MSLLTSTLYSMRLISADEEVSQVEEDSITSYSIEVTKSSTSFEKPNLEFLGKDIA